MTLSNSLCFSFLTCQVGWEYYFYLLVFCEDWVNRRKVLGINISCYSQHVLLQRHLWRIESESFQIPAPHHWRPGSDPEDLCRWKKHLHGGTLWSHFWDLTQFGLISYYGAGICCTYLWPFSYHIYSEGKPGYAHFTDQEVEAQRS